MPKIKIQLKAEELKKKLNLKDGVDGATGPKGDKGDSIVGPKGDRGLPGKDGESIVGPPGLDGLEGKNGSPDTRAQIVEKINAGGKDDIKIEAIQVIGFEKAKSDLDFALGVLDQRTQFLLNKRSGSLDSIVAGTNVTIDNSDPRNPIISATGGGGSGTVTTVSVVTANGISGSVANPTTTPAITLDITALDATKIANGNVSNTEFQYLDGVTSSIQTQLDGKQASGTYVTSVTGTLNRITSTGGTTPTIDISASYVGQASITTLGTIATGTWNGTIIIGTYGGTGVNNGTKTLTYLKNISLTSADDTGVYTLPTGTKTLVATDVATLSSLVSVGTLTTGGAGTGFVIGGVTMTLGSDATNDMYYRNSSGVLTRFASGNNGVLITSGAGVPSISSTIPSATQDNITRLGTIVAGMWNGTAIANANLANSTISGISLGGTLAALTATDSTLTFSGSYTGATARTVGINLATANTWTGVMTLTPAARSSGAASYFTVNTPADTGITAATESKGINHVGGTRTWADGTVTTQREYFFGAPTYNKTTTSATFTNVATLAISGAPTAGTGVTLTHPWALWVQAGNSHFGAQVGATQAAISGSGAEFNDSNNTTGGQAVSVQNTSAGTSAFSGLELGNNQTVDGGATSHFFGIFFNSSTYSDTTFGTAFAIASLGALQNSDGPIAISAQSATGYVNFITGGSAAENEVGRFTTSGLTVGLTGTLTGAIKFAGATSTSITLQGQAVGSSGVLTLPAVTGLLTTGMRGFIDGFILSNNATNVLNIAAGSCRDGGNTYMLDLASAITKNLQTSGAWTAGTGNSGLDTGAAAATTWYHVWAISKADGTSVDVLFSLSATAPTMPSTYTLKRRIGAMKTDGSKNWVAFTQYHDEFWWSVPVLDINVTNPTTSAVTRTLASVPTGVVVNSILSISGSGVTPATDNPAGIFISPLALTDSAPTATVMTFIAYSSPANIGGRALCWTNTSAQIRSRVQISTAGTGFSILTLGWVDPRGKNA